MGIDPKAKIAGLPMLRVRDALKRVARGDWTVGRLQDTLRADPSEVATMLAALQREGYVEPVPQPASLRQPASPPHPERWRTTPKGDAFVQATARPVSRAAAQRHLDGLLARLAEVRDDPRWLYKARRVQLFGSFLDPGLEVVGGVDLAVDLARKEPDEAIHRERERAYIQRQWDEGRIFRSFQQEQMCPSNDVLKFLKKRSWILNLHPMSEFERLPDAPSRLLYEDPDA